MLVESNALKLSFTFSGGSSIRRKAWSCHTIAANFPCFFFPTRTPIAEASLKPQSRLTPNCGSSQVPQYVQEASPTASRPHAALLAAEAYGDQSDGMSLAERLRLKGSCPLRLLREDGDWSRDQFWEVVELLRHASKSSEILRLFESWKNMRPSRIMETDYNMIIDLLCEEGHLNDAVLALKELSNNSPTASLVAYRSVLCRFANRGRFEEVSLFLSEMKKQDLLPDASIYKCLIKAYGKYRMYDEMDLCVKWMEGNGCSPDYVTYNLLIREYSRGGLIQRMEHATRTMLSRRMYIQPTTLVSILEVYTKFGVLDKMESAYVRVLNSKALLNEELIRKMASVYLANFMFSRMDDLGLNHPSTMIGDLSWCLRLISHACVPSHRGIDSIINEMKEERIQWSVTLVNIVLLAYLKMEDIKRLKILLSELPARNVEPDIVTLGVLMDAKRLGFDVADTLHSWRRTGFLHGYVELGTDPLVLVAFGKGRFLKSCEEIYSSLESKERDTKRWSYCNLLDMVDL